VLFHFKYPLPTHFSFKCPSALNILNKYWRAPDKWWSSSLTIGRGA